MHAIDPTFDRPYCLEGHRCHYLVRIDVDPELFMSSREMI